MIFKAAGIFDSGRLCFKKRGHSIIFYIIPYISTVKGLWHGVRRMHFQQPHDPMYAGIIFLIQIGIIRDMTFKGF
jgi:hypothetical protein